MGNKLVMHCRGSRETVVRYNKYVVSGKLFHTLVLMSGIGLRTLTCACRLLMEKRIMGS